MTERPECRTHDQGTRFSRTWRGVLAVCLTALLQVALGAQVSRAQLTCDTALTSSIGPVNETEEFTFAAQTGEIVSLWLEEDAAAASTFNLRWRVLTAAGEEESECGNWSQATSRNCGPLAGDESPYRIQIEDFGADTGGDYFVHLQRVTYDRACDSAPLACDTPATFSLNPIGDTDLRTFGAIDDEIVQINVGEVAGSSTSFQAYWRVLDRSGAPASSCGSFNNGQRRDCGSLSAAEAPYQVEIKDLFGDDIGNYRIHLQRLTLERVCDRTSIVCDSTQNGDIEEIGDGDLWPVCVTDNTTLNITIEEQPGAPVQFQAYWRLLTREGLPASACGSFALSNERECGPLPAADRPYFLEVRDLLDDTAGDYTVTADVVSGQCTSCEAYFQIFTDGFEPGNTSAWSKTVGR